MEPKDYQYYVSLALELGLSGEDLNEYVKNMMQVDGIDPITARKTVEEVNRVNYNNQQDYLERMRMQQQSMQASRDEQIRNQESLNQKEFGEDNWEVENWLRGLSASAIDVVSGLSSYVTGPFSGYTSADNIQEVIGRAGISESKDPSAVFSAIDQASKNGTIASTPPALDSFRRNLVSYSDSIRAGMDSYEQDIIGNIADMNLYTAGKQIATAAFESAPQMAVAIAGGPVGIGIVGAATAGNAFHEVKDDPDMGYWEKIGYSVASGSVESISNMVGGKIVSRALGDGAKSVASTLASREFLRGVAKSSMYGFAAESVEEGIAGALETANRYAFLEDEFTTKQMLSDIGRSALNGMVVGGAIGGSLAGSVYTTAAALRDRSQTISPISAMNSPADRLVGIGSPLRMSIDRLSREVQQETDPTRKKELGEELRRRRAEFESASRERESIYRAIRVKSPDTYYSLIEADNNISRLVSLAKSMESSDMQDVEAREATMKEIKQKISEEISKRGQLFESAASMDTNLTPAEMIQDALNDINGRIREVRSDLDSVKGRDVKTSDDRKAYISASKRLKSLQQKKAELLKMVGEYGSISDEQGPMFDSEREAIMEKINDIVLSDMSSVRDSSRASIITDDQLRDDNLHNVLYGKKSPSGRLYQSSPEDRVVFDSANVDDQGVDTSVASLAKNLLSAFRSSDIKVVFHKTRESFEEAVDYNESDVPEGFAVNAIYDNANTIHISLVDVNGDSISSAETMLDVRHEFIHGALKKIISSDSPYRSAIFKNLQGLAKQDYNLGKLFKEAEGAYSHLKKSDPALYEEEVITMTMEKISDLDVKPGIIKRLSDFIRSVIAKYFGGSNPYNIESDDDFLAIARKFNIAAKTGMEISVNAEGIPITRPGQKTAIRRHPDLINREVTFFQNTGTRFSPRMSSRTIFAKDYFDFREQWADITDNGRRKDLMQNPFYTGSNGKPKRISDPTPIKGYRRPEPETVAGETQAEASIIERFEKEIVAAPNVMPNLMAAVQAETTANITELSEVIMSKFKEFEKTIKKKYGITDFKDYDDQGLKKYLIDAYTYEAIAALSSHPEALGWYDEKITNAMAIMSAVHPELRSDKESQDILKIALAITSNGNRVVLNFQEADKQYNFFKKNKRFIQTGNVGVQAATIDKSFEFINKLLDRGMTVPQLVTFMTKKFKVSDMRYTDKNGNAKLFVNGELMSTEVFGASILGPKIGDGFFMNLYGNFDQLTMDRWFMRQYGRLTGTLVKDVDESVPTARFEQAVRGLTDQDLAAVEEMIPGFGDMNLSERGKAVFRAALEKDNRDSMFSSNERLNELRKSSNEYNRKVSQNLINEAPANGKQRSFIRSVFKSVAQKLDSEFGITISQADLQAVLWYPEKDLYKKSKEKVSLSKEDIDKNEQPDYESAARKLATEKYRISEEEIESAVSTAGATARAKSNRESLNRRIGELGGYDSGIAEQVKNVISAVKSEREADIDEQMEKLNSLSIERPVGPNPENRTYDRKFAIRKAPQPRTQNQTGQAWDVIDRNAFESALDNLQVKFQDKYAEIWLLQEGVRRARGSMAESQDFKMAEELMYGKAAEDIKKLENTMDDIYDYMRKNKISDDDISDYLYAKHVEERNRVIAERTEGENTSGSGKTTEEATAYLNSIPAEKRAKLEPLANMIYAILKDTRKTMVDFQLESQEVVDSWESMYKNYVPLWGFATDEKSEDKNYYPTGGAGIQAGKRSVKKAKGRFSEAENILANIVTQNAAIKIQARKNEALQSLYKLVQNNPNEEVWYVSKAAPKNSKKAVGVRIGGFERFIVFQNEHHAMSLKDSGVQRVNGLFRFLSNATTFTRLAFTSYSPSFVIDNFIRDIQTALANVLSESEISDGIIKGKDIAADMLANISKNTHKLLRLSFNKGADVDPRVKKMWEEFLEDGGKTGWMYSKPLQEIQADIEVETDPNKRSKRAARVAKKKILGTIESINDAIENTTRFAAYMAARDNGVSRKKAAQLAKNLTVNFNKSGEYGQALNAVYLFFNSSVQGSARLLRSMTRLSDKKKPNGEPEVWYKRLNGAQKLAFGLTTMNVMITMFNMAISEEEEDGLSAYEKIPDYEKERNIIIMTDSKNHVSIPLPYGMNIFPAMGLAMAEAANGQRKPLDASMFIFGSILSSFSPINFGNSEKAFGWSKAFVPTMLRPLIDIVTNENYFAEAIYRERLDYEGPISNSELAYKSPEFVKEFFSFLNEATGGDEFKSGAVDINPDVLLYLFSYYLGGAGRFVGKTYNVAAKAISGEDITSRDMPIGGKYYGTTQEWYDVDAYYKNMDKARILIEQYKASEPSERNDPKFQNAIEVYNAMRSAEKSMRRIREMKNRIKNAPPGFDQFVKEKEKEIKDAEDMVIVNFNKVANKNLR